MDACGIHYFAAVRAKLMAGTFLAAGVRVSRRHVLKAFLIGVGSLAAAAGSLVQFYGPLLAQTSSTAPALYSVHMVDTLTGWAVGTRGGLPLRGGVESVLHTTDGGIHWIDVTPPSPPGRTMFHLYDVDVLTSLGACVLATA